MSNILKAIRDKRRKKKKDEMISEYKQIQQEMIHDIAKAEQEAKAVAEEVERYSAMVKIYGKDAISSALLTDQKYMERFAQKRQYFFGKYKVTLAQETKLSNEIKTEFTHLETKLAYKTDYARKKARRSTEISLIQRGLYQDTKNKITGMKDTDESNDLLLLAASLMKEKKEEENVKLLQGFYDYSSNSENVEAREIVKNELKRVVTRIHNFNLEKTEISNNWEEGCQLATIPHVFDGILIKIPQLGMDVLEVTTPEELLTLVGELEKKGLLVSEAVKQNALNYILELELEYQKQLVEESLELAEAEELPLEKKIASTTISYIAKNQGMTDPIFDNMLNTFLKETQLIIEQNDFAFTPEDCRMTINSIFSGLIEAVTKEEPDDEWYDDDEKSQLYSQVAQTADAFPILHSNKMFDVNQNVKYEAFLGKVNQIRNKFEVTMKEQNIPFEPVLKKEFEEFQLKQAVMKLDLLKEIADENVIALNCKINDYSEIKEYEILDQISPTMVTVLNVVTDNMAKDQELKLIYNNTTNISDMLETYVKSESIEPNVTTFGLECLKPIIISMRNFDVSKLQLTDATWVEDLEQRKDIVNAAQMFTILHKCVQADSILANSCFENHEEKTEFIQKGQFLSQLYQETTASLVKQIADKLPMDTLRNHISLQDSHGRSVEEILKTMSEQLENTKDVPKTYTQRKEQVVKIDITKLQKKKQSEEKHTRSNLIGQHRKIAKKEISLDDPIKE